jgi:transposase-like protein
MEASELKRRLAQGRGRGRSGYPAELREAVLAYAARRRSERVSQDKVAAELGMSAQTLCYWRALARQRGGIAPVTIVAQRDAEPEVVVECGPLRVRGLDVGGVADLLRRLG